MNAIVQTMQRPAPSKFTTDQIDLIKRTVCRGASDDELEMFIHQAKRTGLDPLARQIYAVKRWDGTLRKEVMSIQTSIDGFRLIAERTGKYEGQDGPYWCGPDGEWRDVWLSNTSPFAARVGILRSDFKVPLYSTARFDAYAQRNKEGQLNRMWKTMGDVMIAKCAEALGLRRAFPQELSGLYTNDEMAQASNETVEVVERHPPEPAPNKIEAPTGDGIEIELDVNEPRTIGVRDDGWPGLARRLKAMISQCETIERAHEWRQANDEDLTLMRKEAPGIFKKLAQEMNIEANRISKGE